MSDPLVPGSNPPLASFQQHQQAGARHGPLGFAVITMSDTRTAETDTSGQFIKEAVAGLGHRLEFYRIVKDEPSDIRTALEAALAQPEVAIVITNGGTGISLRDNAFEVISSVLDKRLDGFGEMFRMLSYQDIGAAAMLSRAVGGVSRGKVIFALPGSTKAVRLGMEKLILPQAGHLYFELHR